MAVEIIATTISGGVSANKVVEAELCNGCGFCQFNSKGQYVETKFDYSESIGSYAPIGGLLEDRLCPTASLDVEQLAVDKFGNLPDDQLIGHNRETLAAWSQNTETRKQAASGGIVPAIIEYLFRKRKIDCAYMAHPGQSLRSGKGQVIGREESLLEYSGSIYHPIDFGSGFNELFESDQKFAFVGLPCQIAGLQQLAQRRPDIKNRIVLTIGLFCGGINSINGVGYYLESMGIAVSKIKNVQYRHGSWPGKIRAEFDDGSTKIIERIRGNTRIGILKYVAAFQGYFLLPKCRICPDQLAEFADISVGDPHLPKYRKDNNHGVSAVITRSEKGSAVLSELKHNNLIDIEPLSREELIQSQGHTLVNRKNYVSYLAIWKLFWPTVPNIKVYPQFESKKAFVMWVAVIDLLKIKLRGKAYLRPLYLPWQIFEYLFLTLAPRLIFSRIKKLVTNT